MPRVADMTDTPASPVMDEEEQAFINDLAAELIDILRHTEQTLASKVKNLDMDETLALWSLLPAKVRSAIKRGGQ